MKDKHTGKILFLFLIGLTLLIGAFLLLSPVTIKGNV